MAAPAAAAEREPPDAGGVVPGSLAFPAMRGNTSDGTGADAAALEEAMFGMISNAEDLHILHFMQQSIDRNHAKGRAMLLAELSAQWQKRRQLVANWEAWVAYHVRVVLLLRKSKRNRQIIFLREVVRGWSSWLQEKKHRRRRLQERLSLSVARRALRNCMLAWHELKEQQKRRERLINKMLNRSPAKRMKEAFDLWRTAAGGKHCCIWKELKQNNEERHRVHHELEAAEHELLAARAASSDQRASKVAADAAVDASLADLRRYSELTRAEQSKQAILTQLLAALRGAPHALPPPPEPAHEEALPLSARAQSAMEAELVGMLQLHADSKPLAELEDLRGATAATAAAEQAADAEASAAAATALAAAARLEAAKENGSAVAARAEEAQQRRRAVVASLAHRIAAAEEAEMLQQQAAADAGRRLAAAEALAAAADEESSALETAAAEAADSAAVEAREAAALAELPAKIQRLQQEAKAKVLLAAGCQEQLGKIAAVQTNAAVAKEVAIRLPADVRTDLRRRSTFALLVLLTLYLCLILCVFPCRWIRRQRSNRFKLRWTNWKVRRRPFG